MVNNKLDTQDTFRVKNCLKIFTTLCGYQTISYEAKNNLNFLKIQNPLPLLVDDDGTILVIHEKTIFDEKNHTPIKATNHNFKQYLPKPYKKENFSMTYYDLIQLAKDDRLSDASSNDNSTASVKYKTSHKSSKSSSSLTKSKQQNKTIVDTST